jgi:ribonuclease VapC
MSTIVLDASVVIALLKQEPGCEQVEPLLVDSMISSVNYAEVVSYFAHKGLSPSQIDDMLKPLPINIVSADEKMARLAGALRIETAHAGLSLGDRFCLALALVNGVEAWTTDRQWQSISVSGLVVKVIR